MSNKTKLFNDKMQELTAILEFLSAEFNVQYALNYTKLSTDGKHVLLQDMLYNKGLDNNISNHFIENLTRYQEFINKIPNLIRKGEFVVMCIDDANKPANIGDWPKKDLHYIVDEMVLTQDKKNYAFTLRGMKINPPYTGYSMNRFVRVMTEEIMN